MRKQKLLNPEAEVLKRSELPGKCTAKILFRQNNRRFKDEYLKKLKRSSVRWKGKERQILMEAKP